MDTENASAVDLSAEAILEIQELKEGVREDAPALGALFSFLRTPIPSPSFNGHAGVSMLADVRSYELLRKTVGPRHPKLTAGDFQEFQKLFLDYLNQVEEGVRAKQSDKMDEAKSVCIALHEGLVSKQMSELYERRERADSRYLVNAAL